MPNMGLALQSELLHMDQLEALLKLAADGQLSTFSFAKLYRARRDYRKYLKSLLGALEAEGRTTLVLHLCRYVNARMQAPRFARKQRAIEAELKQQAAGKDATDVEDTAVAPKQDADTPDALNDSAAASKAV
jgi:hypothetical protein